ncbi:glycosyltransferase [Acetatifactor muris]|uniref:Putative glycosyltransferase EpsJ n=1 Tax=Acetatifactor muris TaxID=879566 RepID=A0A2K4ZI69_9FIRM|nr:glycosyltransferase family 2 protein [Acetatifactor muris]MCR2048374.1 glycosyltransferase [Acetatifactor muris]SOY30178.1 putative glycosyltransferase EpsJ [Acetatifactor muris]
MKDTPLITVIVPVYNILEYLPRCVHSITAQTYQNLEIILVDDGSTDGTGALCDELAAEDRRIRVYHKENGGSSSARNLALRYAAGEYVGFVDSDDYIAPGMYQRLMDGIRNFSVSAAQTGRDEIDEKGNALPNICEPPEEPVVIEDRHFMEELLLHRGDCSFCTKLIRRDLFPEDGFPPDRLNEDFHLLIRMLPEMGEILSLPGQDYHVFYRIGSNSRKADRETFSRVYGDSVENADMAAELVKRNYPELEKTAFRFGVFQRLEYLLHIPISQMRRDNGLYMEVVSYLRKNWLMAMKNPILTGKNKIYHTLFGIAPKKIRQLHAALRR